MQNLDISKALSINGYMSEHELHQLAVWAGKFGSIVEIGSYMGRSTRALADHTPGTVTVIDDFHGLRENAENPSPEDIYAAFTNNLADHLTAGTVRAYVMNHDRPFRLDCDMCFIDGSHDYESVKRDIQSWSHAKMLCGHDFDAIHSGVMAAVDEMVQGYRVIPGTSLWWREL